ncbi:MAG: TrmH family RNA methyltransferase [Thermoplasmatota archaeon]
MAQRVGISGAHAVLQALASGREVHSVLVAREAVAGPALAEIREAAGKRGLAVRDVGLAELVAAVGGSSQGVGALVAALENVSVLDILARARAANEPPLVVAVDGIEDPQNLGAIARSALLAGAHGILVPERGTASLGEGAMKAAAGAFSLLPVARLSSLGTALATLRREGVWLVGADANRGRTPWRAKLTGPLCLVLGGEHAGLSKQTLEVLDETVCIPTPGGDLSLNVSAAAAVLLFERLRQATTKPTAH